MATTAIIGGAIIGAAGSYLGAKESNKKKTTWTDQTTTQNPYMAGQIAPDINEVLNYQRGLVQRGAPTIGKNGQLTYAALPVGTRPGGLDSYSDPNDPRFKNFPGPKDGGINHPGGPGNIDKGANQNKPIYSESTAAGGGKKGKNKGGGGGGGGQPAGPAAPAPTSAGDIFREAAERGFAAGDTETIKQGRTAMGNILGAAGGGGPESSGFEGYNPIMDRLSKTLESDVGSRQGKELLMKFLAGNQTGAPGLGGIPTGGSSSGGSTYSPKTAASAGEQSVSPAKAARGMVNQEWMARNNPTPPAVEGDPAAAAAAQTAAPSAPSSGPVHGRPVGAGDVPDTMAVQSFFNDETRKLMDEKANEEELAGLINAMNADTEKGMFRDMAQLDAAAAGSGRFGGDMWKGMSDDAREEALQEMLKTSSGVRMGDREARRQARLSALQGVNQRDLGLLGANVQREGIAANERASANAAASGAASMEAQMELARRGQDLSAIGALMDSEQFSLGQLGDVGSQLSGDRLNTLGLIPGLEGVGLGGINAALGGGQGLNDITGMQNQLKLGQASLGVQRQGLNQQAAMWNAGQSQNLVNNYMGTLMNVGSMGGTSTTKGQNVQPGMGVSPGAAAAMGGMGGALSTYGALYGGR